MPELVCSWVMLALVLLVGLEVWLMTATPSSRGICKRGVLKRQEVIFKRLSEVSSEKDWLNERTVCGGDWLVYHVSCFWCWEGRKPHVWLLAVGRGEDTSSPRARIPTTLGFSIAACCVYVEAAAASSLTTVKRLSYLSTPPLGQDMTQGQFLSGV